MLGVAGTSVHLDLLDTKDASRKAIALFSTEPVLGITIDEDKLIAQVGEPSAYRARFAPDDGSVVAW